MSIATWSASDDSGGGFSLARDYLVGFAGDSTTAGVGAGNGTGINPSITGAWPFAFPSQTSDALAALGVPSVYSPLSGDNNNGTGTTTWNEYRPDIVLTNTLNTSTTWGPAFGGPVFGPMVTATLRELVWQSLSPHDTLDMYCLQQTAAGTFAVDIDGGSGGGGSTLTFSNQNATDRIFKHTISGLSLGTHTFRFTRNSGTAFMPLILVPRTEGQFAVRCVNGGMRNTLVTNWNEFSAVSKRGSMLANVPWDVMVINLGINDFRSTQSSPTSFANFDAAMQALITSSLSIGTKVILMVPTPIQNYNTTVDAWSQAEVLSRYQALQAANPTTILFNTPEVLFEAGLSGATNPATYASMSSLYYPGDNLHPTAAIYGPIGEALGPVIKTALGL
jgi:lysophospholipase L1-like esterase